MVCITKLFATLLAVATASAVKVTFRRYTMHGCDASHHIRKDTHLTSNNCKDFSRDEPVFHAYSVHPDHKHHTDTKHHLCKATVFEDLHCKGKGFTVGDFNDSWDTCVNSTVGARSVRISCDHEEDPNVVTSSLPSPTLTVIPVTHTTVTHTASASSSLSTRTITLVPQSDAYWD